jgi:hypothetical protein
MYLPQQSFQLSPSVTNSYDQQERFERGVKNTEGISTLQCIRNLIICIFQENLD